MEQLSITWSSKTVVIVEDDCLVRDLAVCELADQGYTVVEFETADDALPYLVRHGRDAAVIVTDVQMPGSLSGLDLAAILSNLCPDVPVLVTSGGPLVDPRRLPSCATFLAKPFLPEDMVARIRRMIGTAH